MKRKRTVVSPSQLSVVEPSKSFFLEMLVFTVESKADFSVAPGAGRGGAGRREGAGPESRAWVRSVVWESLELLSWESVPALKSWACPQVTGNLTFQQGTLDPLGITRALGVHRRWGWEEKVAGIKKKKKRNLWSSCDTRQPGWPFCVKGTAPLQGTALFGAADNCRICRQ